MVADWEKILPGAAERILATMEREAGHRHRLESDSQVLEHKRLEHDVAILQKQLQLQGRAQP